MNRTMSLTGRPIRQLAAGLSTVAAALGVATLGVTGTVSAQAATRSAITVNSTPVPIPVNTLNWSGSACCGSRAPAWYKDRSGVIHLQGAVTQANSSGPGANLLGTLPPAARPLANVFTIVHTASGTYADLVVLTNGQIGLLDPRPPAVKDYSFVSLEGITYRP